VVKTGEGWSCSRKEDKRRKKVVDVTVGTISTGSGSHPGIPSKREVERSNEL